MHNLSDFDYELPAELIAQNPSYRREQARLLTVRRDSLGITHHSFGDITEFFEQGDLFVLNDTKVIPARLSGRRASGGKVEVLLLKPEDKTHRTYQALIKPLGRLKKNEKIFFGQNYSCRLIDAEKKIVFFEEVDGREVMRKVGALPLPPYIRRAPTLLDRSRYQTVFAREEGAVAAPTAGLHFSKALLAKLKRKGVGLATLTLHVNYATFSPVRSQDIREHKMQPESYEIPAKTVGLIRETKKNKKRVVAIGTTVCKALEDARGELSDQTPLVKIARESRLFIYPPFRFSVVDAMVTNFHLPRTSLLLLVSAFAGRDLIFSSYREAVRASYHFYSYGDAMLIL